ncbi:MAG: 7-carboxy-7-deazaguanine synthase QueE [Candidatus Thiodiazotropha lotti]|uniref:7-carboxy-7-deazaguanine synthase n=1 Tax=Candidatus Thiodiazotropha lotti TaxID=2792787 RepID=A0A9E4MZX3_9GAMM|nr:7-carboxy-7-deazaguanine synthase QueE [Candidatus Thiodiazotropha lotti]ODB93045.1 7-carboxy-7-deazaguanine synthase QueE [Candidatus Thiodiazotropha endoloripes]MCG7922486.1 7-carboxy-7-deazaguanine synthase QueE [Candidatus Thiodiazotropha lotti]MCG7929328.1 7-carboxy-7-deazaguanine synthase QueE [Candidatus Thiodiazotropha lotti]MCG7937924.1 7-carboxy-7-deazaguanine synthase QueE [Candidatus Thiodiazotropha lotti]
MSQIRITEIFVSLQGESNTVGLPTVFIRLTGCPLRCVYCDTEYAFSGGEKMSIESILQQLSELRINRVCVTGGEPLAQAACTELLRRLCDAGYEISLETSGALDISAVDPRVVRVIDLKTPGSGEVSKNRLTNLDCLRESDQLKFVISGRDDYEWSRAMLKDYALEGECEILFSPVHGKQNPTQLAEWILQDRLNVRFQMQLHKLLWNDQPGR